ncbi:MAG: hypothetical protein ACXVFI_01935 [Solirubrobacteraceae bacterium]
MTFRYQWQRCNSKGRACKSLGIPRQHGGNVYVPSRRDIGHTVRVAVIASAARRSASSTSRPTRVIARTRATRPHPGSPARDITAYVTGYGIYDNTPPGSTIISNPVIHRVAGGTGTYRDPVTVAVGHALINGHDILDWPQATRFYIPNLRRYFVVEDTCGDGPTPQNGPCHNLSTADPGAQTWLDVWVDGSQMSTSATNSCEDAITHNQLVIKDPARDYAVTPGPIAGSRCAMQYGNAVVRSGG